MPMGCYNKRPEETSDDFFVRIGNAVLARELTWDGASKVLNDELGKNFGECAYRKRFKAFRDGMQYQESLSNRDVGTCILSISDLHIPFQKPIETFSEYAGKIDILQVNGDLVDETSLSKFVCTYKVSPMDELIEARQYMMDLIELIKPKKVLVNYGNHELRMERYLAKNLDNELQELMPETVFDLLFTDGFTHYDRKSRAKVKYQPLCDVFKDIDIEYSGTWFSQYKDIIFCHPRAFSSSPLKTAEKAMYWFRNEGYSFSCIVMAHTHRIGSYKIGNTMIYEQGCCCDTKQMRYTDGNLTNSQKEGFMLLYLDKDGHFLEEKSKLVYLN